MDNICTHVAFHAHTHIYMDYISLFECMSVFDCKSVCVYKGERIFCADVSMPAKVVSSLSFYVCL